MCEQFTSTDVLFYMAKNIAKTTLELQKGEKIVITGGDTSGQSGKTSLIKVEEMNR
jgi:pyruvate kinase